MKNVTFALLIYKDDYTGSIAVASLLIACRVVQYLVSYVHDPYLLRFPHYDFTHIVDKTLKFKKHKYIPFIELHKVILEGKTDNNGTYDL